MRTRLLKGGVWVLIGQFGTGVSQILIAMLLARILLPDQFGEFQVVQRIVLFMSMLASFGMGWVIVRRIADGIATNRLDLCVFHSKNIFFIVTTAAIFLSVVFAIWGESISVGFFSVDISPVIWLIIGLIICATYQQVIPEGYRGLHDLKSASLFSGAMPNLIFLVLLAGILLIIGQTNLKLVLTIFFVSSLLAVLISGTVLVRRLLALSQITPTVSYEQSSHPHVTKDNVSAGVSLTLSNVTAFLVNQSDVWIVAALFSTREAGLYAAASRLGFFVTAPVMIANGVIRPFIVSLWSQNDKVRLETLLRSVSLTTTVIGAIPVLLSIVWGREILELVYGNSFSEGSDILVAISIGWLSLLILGPAGTFMILVGHQKQYLYCTIIGGMAFVLASIFLYEFWGTAASIAVAASIGMATNSIATSIYTYKFLGVRTFIGNFSVIKGLKDA